MRLTTSRYPKFNLSFFYLIRTNRYCRNFYLKTKIFFLKQLIIS